MVVIYGLILVVGVCGFSAVIIAVEMWLDRKKENKNVF